MPTGEAQKRANAAYNRRQDNIMLRPSKEDGARIRKAVADAGKSVQRFCLDFVLPHCPEVTDVPTEDTAGKVEKSEV